MLGLKRAHPFDAGKNALQSALFIAQPIAVSAWRTLYTVGLTLLECISLIGLTVFFWIALTLYAALLLVIWPLGIQGHAIANFATTYFQMEAERKAGRDAEGE